jgi:MFS transporter, DHA1 family, multidrug resistance protein
MAIRPLLLFMTFVAVISDSLLHPFYPHFFEIRFGVTHAAWVGYYISALCFAVMISFPAWAAVAKKISELKILVVTQFIAGMLALSCYYVDSYVGFWLLSITMLFFKSSYLLTYPYILRILPKECHSATISTLSVMVHVGGILGAIIGGFVLEYISPATAFIIMAIGDFFQLFISLYLLCFYRAECTVVPTINIVEKTPMSWLVKIGVVTLLFYFCDYMIRPFFVKYWMSFNSSSSTFLTGFIYALPGMVALMVLVYNLRHGKTEQVEKLIIINLVVVSIGLFLQSIQYSFSVIAGRLIYGVSFFQASIQFDLLLFRKISPTNYATDYSKIYFLQSLGVLLASFIAGLTVTETNYQPTFQWSLAGVMITATVFICLFNMPFKKCTKPQVV